MQDREGSGSGSGSPGRQRSCSILLLSADLGCWTSLLHWVPFSEYQEPARPYIHTCDAHLPFISLIKPLLEPWRVVGKVMYCVSEQLPGLMSSHVLCGSQNVSKQRFSCEQDRSTSLPAYQRTYTSSEDSPPSSYWITRQTPKQRPSSLAISSMVGRRMIPTASHWKEFKRRGRVWFLFTTSLPASHPQAHQ